MSDAIGHMKGLEKHFRPGDLDVSAKMSAIAIMRKASMHGDGRGHQRTALPPQLSFKNKLVRGKSIAE